MELISMDIRVFNALSERVENMERTAEILYRKQDDLGLKRWLDNQDVCEMLGITKRTLQKYRERKLIPYAIFRHKVFYRLEDVEAMLQSSHHPKTRKP